MKAHLAKVSLALLSAVFLFGCQEQGSEPVGPDGLEIQAMKGGKGKGGGGGKAVGTLDLADGMQAAVLPVDVKDSDEKLTVNNTDFMPEIEITMDFTPTGGGVYEIGACTVIAGNTGFHFEKLDVDVYQFLLEELTASGPRTAIFLEIDKSGLTVEPRTDDRHLLLVDRNGTFENAGGNTWIMLGPTYDDVGVVPGTVTWVRDDPNIDVFEFTGPVVVWATGVGGGGGRKSTRIIACGGANDNKVTVTINRSPA